MPALNRKGMDHLIQLAFFALLRPLMKARSPFQNAGAVILQQVRAKLIFVQIARHRPAFASQFRLNYYEQLSEP